MKYACALILLALAACGRGHAATTRDTTQPALPPPPAPHDTLKDSIHFALDSGLITPSEVAAGEQLFNGNGGDGICATCHGLNGAGTGSAPPLNDRAWINGDGSIGFIKGTMIQGVPHPKEHPLPMPPFGHTFTEDQLQALAAYVYALSHGGKQ